MKKGKRGKELERVWLTIPVRPSDWEEIKNLMEWGNLEKASIGRALIRMSLLEYRGKVSSTKMLELIKLGGF